MVEDDRELGMQEGENPTIKIKREIPGNKRHAR